jgi:maleate isomerase
MMSRAIGQIVPSSNRTVERTTQAVLRHLPGVDSCCARITYYGAGQGQPKHGYDLEGYRLAAWQLGHARVDVVSWNGTKGASIGLAEDEALCRVMSEAGSCPATTASLDARRLLRALGVARAGFVTPGDAAYAEQSAANLGVALAGVRALGLSDNLASAAVAPETIAAEIRALAGETRCDAILLWSTNLPGWSVMAGLEAELGIPVLDSACIGIWGCLVAAGIDPRPAVALGRMFGVPG